MNACLKSRLVCWVYHFHFFAPSIIALHVHVYVRVWNDFNAGIVSFPNELRSHCTNMAELTGSAY